MIRYSNIVLIFVLMFVLSCKSSKKAIESKANSVLSTKEVIKQNAEKSPVFKTLESKLKITYSQKENSQIHTVSFRVKKDEIIWMSAMFSVVKVFITPEKVSYFNKLNSTYFEGDFSYLSKLLGTEIDFKKLQNLLIGEALFDFEANSYKTTIVDGNYMLEPKMKNEIFDILYVIDPTIFKVKSQQITQSNEQRRLQIDYKSHQEINNQLIPETMKIFAVNNTEEVTIDLEFLNVSLNQELTFPFKIPSGFDKIKL